MHVTPQQLKTRQDCWSHPPGRNFGVGHWQPSRLSSVGDELEAEASRPEHVQTLLARAGTTAQRTIRGLLGQAHPEGVKLRERWSRRASAAPARMYVPVAPRWKERRRRAKRALVYSARYLELVAVQRLCTVPPPEAWRVACTHTVPHKITRLAPRWGERGTRRDGGARNAGAS